MSVEMVRSPTTYQATGESLRVVVRQNNRLVGKKGEEITSPSHDGVGKRES